MALGYVLELIFGICIDLAMAILLWNLFSPKGNPPRGSRCIAATFAIGLIIGTILAGFRGIAALIVLNAIGCILTGAAFLLTFSGKKSGAGDKQ